MVVPPISCKYPSKEALIADRQSSLWNCLSAELQSIGEKKRLLMHCARKTCLFSHLPKLLFVLCQRSGSYSCYLIYTTLSSPFYLLPSLFFSLPILFLPSPLLSPLLVRRHHCLFGCTTINASTTTTIRPPRMNSLSQVTSLITTIRYG